jgi:hypothetical protein
MENYGFAPHFACLKTFFTALGRVGFFHQSSCRKSFIPDMYIALTTVTNEASFTS